jgi:hypothetical protein
MLYPYPILQQRSVPESLGFRVKIFPLALPFLPSLTCRDSDRI